MQRYYFHLSAPGSYNADDVGVEFPGVEAAYLGAYQAALDMSVEMLRQRIDPALHSFQIADQAGQVLFDLSFAEVMRPSAKPPPPFGSIQASIHQRQERTKHAALDLKAAIVRNRELLQGTRDLLTRLSR
jgi:hypothetical protein